MTEETNPLGNGRTEAGKLSPDETSTSRTLLPYDAQDSTALKRCTGLFKKLKLEPLKFDNKKSELSDTEPDMPKNRRKNYKRPKTKTQSDNEMQLMQTNSNHHCHYNYMQVLSIPAMLRVLCRLLKEDDVTEQECLFHSLYQKLEEIKVVGPRGRDRYLDALQIKFNIAFDNLIMSYQNPPLDPVNSSQVPVTDIVPKFKQEFAETLSVLRNWMPNNWNPISQLHTSRYASEFVQMDLLGQGGYGKVYKAQNKVDDMIYAVKKIKLRCTNEHKLVTVQREVQVMASLKHSNIVAYFSSWWETGESFNDSSESLDSTGVSSHSTTTSTNGKHMSVNSKKFKGLPVTLYVQMELCQKTLDMYLKERNDTLMFFKDQDPLEIVDDEFSLDIFQQIVIGVEYIHSQCMMHRDLKPSNVFVDTEKREVKIGDFGLARNEWIGPIEELSEGPYTPLTQQSCKFTAKLGTESYAAPEQLSGSNYDKKADMYSLGFIDFELFYPFGTKMERAKTMQGLKENDGNIPELKKIEERWPLQAKIILQLLCQTPSSRPSASELLEMCPNKSDKEHIKELQMQLRKKEEMIQKMGDIINTKEKDIRRLDAQKKRLYRHIGHLNKALKLHSSEDKLSTSE